MGSIDFSDYIDLTIEDESPETIYEDAVEYGRNTLPELNLRAGTLEDALLQSFAYVGSQTIGAINRLPDGLMEGILKLHGLTRLEATFSTVEVEFTVLDDGSSVPAGTTVIFQDPVDGEQYPFSLSETVTANSGEFIVSGTVTSTTAGPVPDITIGTTLLISEPSSNVLFCETVSTVLNGNSDETTDQFLARGTTYLQSLSRVLTTSLQVQNYILSTFPDVERCKVYDLARAVTFDPGTSLNVSRTGTAATIATNSAFSAASAGNPTYRVLTPDFFGDTTYTAFESGTYSGTFSGNNLNVTSTISGTTTTGPAKVVNLSKLDLFEIEGNPAPGFFCIFICGQDGTPLSNELKQEIEDSISDRIVAGLSFEILDVFVYDIKFNVSIAVESGFVAADVVLAVAEEIESSISPDAWENWDKLVRIFDLVVQASKIPGVSYVYSVSGASIPSSETAPGNDLLFSEFLSGSQLIGYAPAFAGLLPRAQVQVTVA